MKKKIYVMMIIVLAITLIYVVVMPNIQKNNKYMDAVSMLKAGKLSEAIKAFTDLDTYKDSKNKVLECCYKLGVQFLADEDYNQAIKQFAKSIDYKDSVDKLYECHYKLGMQFLVKEDYDQAIKQFTKAHHYSDADTQMLCAYYEKGKKCLSSGNKEEALTYFTLASDYADATEIMQDMIYNEAKELYEKKDYIGSLAEYSKILDYKDVKSILNDINIRDTIMCRARELCHSKDFAEAVKIYNMLPTLDNSQKTVLSYFADICSSVFTIDGYKLKALGQIGTGAQKAVVYFERYHKGSEDEIIKPLFLITEAASYYGGYLEFPNLSQGFDSQAASFANRIDPAYQGPFADQVRELAQYIAPNIIKATRGYYDLSLDEKAEIISFMEERYKHYDSIEKAYTDDQYNEIIRNETAVQYNLSYIDIIMVWNDCDAQTYCHSN